MSVTIAVTKAPADIGDKWAVPRGNTLFPPPVTIKEDGVAVDLAGSSFVMTIVDKRGTTLETLTLGSGIEVVDTGKIQIHATAAETGTWPSDCLVNFVLVWTRPTSPVIVKTIIIGQL